MRARGTLLCAVEQEVNPFLTLLVNYSRRIDFRCVNPELGLSVGLAYLKFSRSDSLRSLGAGASKAVDSRMKSSRPWVSEPLTLSWVAQVDARESPRSCPGSTIISGRATRLRA